MPLKDKEKRNEASRTRMQKMREGVTKQGVTDEGVTVPASYVMGIDGRMYETLPERPRFLTLSDGQVLDRLNQPFGHAPGMGIQEMQACNESSYNFKPRGKR